MPRELLKSSHDIFAAAQIVVGLDHAQALHLVPFHSPGLKTEIAVPVQRLTHRVRVPGFQFLKRDICLEQRILDRLNAGIARMVQGRIASA